MYVRDETNHFAWNVHEQDEMRISGRLCERTGDSCHCQGTKCQMEVWMEECLAFGSIPHRMCLDKNAQARSGVHFFSYCKQVVLCQGMFNMNQECSELQIFTCSRLKCIMLWWRIRIYFTFLSLIQSYRSVPYYYRNDHTDLQKEINMTMLCQAKRAK